MVPVESSCRTVEPHVEPTVAVLSYTYVYCRILSYTVELSYCRYCRTVAILSTTVEHYCRTVEPGLRAGVPAASREGAEEAEGAEGALLAAALQGGALGMPKLMQLEILKEMQLAAIAYYL